MIEQARTVRLFAEAVMRKRFAAMRKNGELGGGGVSIETLILVGIGVAAAIAFGVWIVAKISEKQSQVQ